MTLLRSFSFRLAATYALLFTLSLAVLLGTYHWVSITGPRDAVKDGLRAESAAFAAAYQSDPRRLATALERRAGAPSPRAGFHLLADPQGRTITTNLPSWPRYAGSKWLSIEADIYRDGDEDDHEALALDRRLPDGTRLLIGRDVEELDDLEEAIASAAGYLTIATILLAVLGALLMNRAIGRRIETVSSAATRVIAGDLGGRVALNGSGDDFDRLAGTLNLMLDRVEAGVEAVRRVSDSVAHELRTPLTRLQADLREMEAGETEPKPALTDAIGEAERLQLVFDAVLRISRIESGRHQAQLCPVELHSLLTDAAELYAPEAEERGIRLAHNLPCPLVVAGDRDLLFQAISNILDNAIKFTPPGGRVLVSAVQVGSEAVVRVVDTGSGVPVPFLLRLGERFFRVPSNSEVPGFGLGLCLVEAIASLHRSTVTYGDADPGMVVEWRLPLMFDQAPETSPA